MYFYYPLYYVPAYLQNYSIVDGPNFLKMRQYPPVDTETFSQSAKTFKTLLVQGGILIDRFADKDFSYQVMDAAQKGEHTKVDRLIQSVDGLTVPVKIHYTPSGIQIDISTPPESEEANCCTLTITLKWRA
jgi:hypothetical protein